MSATVRRAGGPVGTLMMLTAPAALGGWLWSAGLLDRASCAVSAGVLALLAGG